ncbi:MAG: hypothetical protein M0Z45_07120 [Actinomycetota bacterium]|nr:hypothetical protein [Actinomycetota bacterium]
MFKFLVGATVVDGGRKELLSLARRYSPIVRNISIALFIYRKIKGRATPNSTKVKVSPGESLLITNKRRP